VQSPRDAGVGRGESVRFRTESTSSRPARSTEGKIMAPAADSIDLRGGYLSAAVQSRARSFLLATVGYETRGRHELANRTYRTVQ